MSMSCVRASVREGRPPTPTQRRSTSRRRPSAPSSIGPGAIQTPINQGAWQTKEALRDLLNLIPYGRIGQPIDIGRGVVWLASDDSEYVTGTTLFIDGGMTLYPGFREGG